MKKLLSILLVVSMVACLCVGLSGCNSSSKLEKEIVGTWVSDIGEVTFNNDGTFSGVLPFEELVEVEGFYTVNSGDQITVKFYYSNNDFSRFLDVSIENDELSIFYYLGHSGADYTRKTV